ncbi:WXG100 family type VII secretion target [Saccharothrix syringae]|uniref:WXG100 family type VII secretion target n=1 Tax=Saccharothrix syringae TaxID=103733 RepID=A0A5Q0HAH3_SACSY|nr:hypothetical protein [Saccharothrix syringae]QFZ23248.1 hypothetical protein EKG83_42635 [Saccharothrix syringae]
MTGFHTDLARLTEGAQDFGAFAERAGRIAADLTGVLDPLGACWGDDAIGQSFAAGHVGPTGDVLTGMGALGAGFGGVGERLAETARTYRDTEQGNTDALRAI